MAGVVQKFVLTSILMWILPIAVLQTFKRDLIPGIAHLSDHSLTLLSGFLAVISVNIMIAFYIYMAMKEPPENHEPDPAFLAAANASLVPSSTNDSEQSLSVKKDE